MGRTQFILAGRLIDGSGSNVRKNVFLAVRDGIITSTGPATDLPCKDTDLIDDFSHCSLLPALVDCSVSLLRSPSIDKTVRLSAQECSVADKKAILERHLSYCHAYGVQGVAACDDITDMVECYKEGREQNDTIDIRTSCHLYRKKKNRPYSKLSGCDFIKISYSANIEDDDAKHPRPDINELNHILQHREQKKVVVVANGMQQVKEALDLECDAIEQGYAMGKDNLRKMAKKGVLWIPGVLRAKNALDGSGSGGDVCCRFSLRYVAPGKAVPGAETFWKKTLAEQLRQLSFARKLGVTTAIGTGAGSVGLLHGESMVEEMKLFIKAGYSLEETIRCASENGARFFGMEELGMLTVGQKATFLITRGTAQQLPRKLSYLEGIYVNGVPSITYRKNP